MFQLTRNYSIASLLGIALVTFALGSFYWSWAHKTLKKQETEANVALTQALSNTIWPKYADFIKNAANLPLETLVNHPKIAELNDELVQKLRGLRVVKVKIFNLQGLTVYSTEAKQIGKKKINNAGLNIAKAGGIASEITYRNQFSAYDSVIEERNVLSSYLPVRKSPEMPVEGVFEVYSDVTPFIKEIKKTQTLVLGVVIGLLLLLYVFLLSFVKKADTIIQKYRKEELRQMAFYDTMTALPNQNGFVDLLKQVVTKAKNNQSLIAVMSINLDRFNLINNSLGHEFGNKVLVASSKRLQSCMRQQDIVCRTGADEFAIIVSSITTVDEILPVAERLLHKLSDQMQIDNRDVAISLSIGIAFYPLDTENDSELAQYASAAMHKAKETGGNRFAFYTDDLNTETLKRFKLEVDLRRAISKNEFTLFYQPRVNLENNKVIGMEALLRWQSPERGLISPVEFIPVLEETDMIIPVGDFVIQQACKQCKAWHDMGYGNLRISINLSAKQFAHPPLVANIKQALADSGLQAKYLELEITESILVEDTEQAIRILEELRALGVYLAIDDFGTGYSSLSYLLRFPVHFLKIDRSFVKDVNKNKSHANLTRAIIAMATSLDLETVAEGVENKEQLSFINQSNCNEIQGFLFSKPVPANEFIGVIQQIDGQGTTTLSKSA